MRTIDADELKKGIEQQFCTACSSEYPNPRCGACDVGECLRYIDDTPTVEAEPVRHAKWYAPASYDPCEWCSNCHERTRWFFDEGFCPNCGAKMDGDNDD